MHPQDLMTGEQKARLQGAGEVTAVLDRNLHHPEPVEPLEHAGVARLPGGDRERGDALTYFVDRDERVAVLVCVDTNRDHADSFVVLPMTARRPAADGHASIEHD